MECAAARRDEPPVLTEIHYQLVLDSPEPREKLKNCMVFASSGAQ